MTEAIEAAEATRVVHRTITPRDLPFVTSTWLKSNRKRGFGRIDSRVYFHWHHRILEALIPRPSVAIIACDREDPDKLFGWIVARFEAPVLVIHYVYVRDGWRRVGIGTSLVRALVERFDPQALAWTHQTDLWDTFEKRLRRDGVVPKAGVFNPYLAWLQWAAQEQRR